MGNGCIFGSNEVNKDVDLINSNNNNNSNLQKSQIKPNMPLNTDGNEYTKTKMGQLIDYFNEKEEEIMMDYNNLKKKTKNISKKNNNEKYELMLKRLLEQKNIKMIGPKRRETIRKEGNKIQQIVHELLQENKNDILKGNKTDNFGTLIIKQPPQKNRRTSMTIDKNSLLTNSNHKKGDNFFKKRNSLNEIINKRDPVDFQKHKTIDAKADY